ncbi:MAG: hypothetical protein ACOYZ7_04970 [Chloroflexota bacterium]
MEFAIAEERAYLLREEVSTEQAKEKAWDRKTSVFGGISRLVFRPKGEEVQIVYNEKRYEPFWHVVCRTSYVYDRQRKYTVPVSGAEVKRVTVAGQEFVLGEKPHFLLSGTEHCEEKSQKEVFIDAVSSEQQDWKHYLSYSREEIDITSFKPEAAIVVPPETRASFIVRQVLSDMIKAIQADVIHEDLVEVSVIDLYLKPVYAFEYLWQSKDRRAVAEFDGLTGEMRTGGKTLRQQIGTMLTPEVLFDVGIDAVDLLVPGGGIAIKVARALSSKKT